MDRVYQNLIDLSSKKGRNVDVPLEYLLGTSAVCWVIEPGQSGTIGSDIAYELFAVRCSPFSTGGTDAPLISTEDVKGIAQEMEALLLCQHFKRRDE
jgi:hypothetical protein